MLKNIYMYICLQICLAILYFCKMLNTIFVDLGFLITMQFRRNPIGIQGNNRISVRVKFLFFYIGSILPVALQYKYINLFLNFIDNG